MTLLAATAIAVTLFAGGAPTSGDTSNGEARASIQIVSVSGSAGSLNGADF